MRALFDKHGGKYGSAISAVPDCSSMRALFHPMRCSSFNLRLCTVQADGLGREVISTFAVDGWNTAATWFTDSNGRDSMTRVRDYRASFNFTAIEPVASNFFPVNAFSECRRCRVCMRSVWPYRSFWLCSAFASIACLHIAPASSAVAVYTQDTASGNVLSIVTDRSQGGASLRDGELELMVHRRLQADDARGVGEPLNETGESLATGHWLPCCFKSFPGGYHCSQALSLSLPLHPSCALGK